MIVADTLNLTVADHRIIYDGKVINSILVVNDPVKIVASISPKHKQSFLTGNLMISDEKGIVYVPLDEVNRGGQCITLEADGSLSELPKLSYEAYLHDKKELAERRLAEALAETTYRK